MEYLTCYEVETYYHFDSKRQRSYNYKYLIFNLGEAKLKIEVSNYKLKELKSLEFEIIESSKGWQKNEFCRKLNFLKKNEFEPLQKIEFENDFFEEFTLSEILQKEFEKLSFIKKRAGYNITKDINKKGIIVTEEIFNFINCNFNLKVQ